MPKIVFLNSKFVRFKDAKIHIEDRGLQFSDSIYEVIPFFKNKLIDYKFHIKRLKFSLNEIKINYKVKNVYLENIFNKLIIKNKINSGVIYLQITRGLQSRDHAYKDKHKPNIIIYILEKKFNTPDQKLEGKLAITTKDLRWKRRDIKSVSLLANVIAKKIAQKKGAYEAILIDNGFVTEGTTSNVWIVKNNILYTHPSNTDILKGITRESIRHLIKIKKMKLIEKKFNVKKLYNADEVFITSSASFVTPIIKIDNKKINRGIIGSISRTLSEIYYDKIKYDRD